MDTLGLGLSRIGLRAGMLCSGNLFGLHEFEHEVLKGHLHLIERRSIKLQILE